MTATRTIVGYLRCTNDVIEDMVMVHPVYFMDSLWLIYALLETGTNEYITLLKDSGESFTYSLATAEEFQKINGSDW